MYTNLPLRVYKLQILFSYQNVSTMRHSATDIVICFSFAQLCSNSNCYTIIQTVTSRSLLLSTKLRTISCYFNRLLERIYLTVYVFRLYSLTFGNHDASPPACFSALCLHLTNYTKWYFFPRHTLPGYCSFRAVTVFNILHFIICDQRCPNKL